MTTQRATGGTGETVQTVQTVQIGSAKPKKAGRCAPGLRPGLRPHRPGCVQNFSLYSAVLDGLDGLDGLAGPKTPEQLAFDIDPAVPTEDPFRPDGPRRCPSCRRRLAHWGGRLICANAYCPGGAS